MFENNVWARRPSFLYSGRHEWSNEIEREELSVFSSNSEKHHRKGTKSYRRCRWNKFIVVGCEEDTKNIDRVNIWYAAHHTICMANAFAILSNFRYGATSLPYSALISQYEHFTCISRDDQEWWFVKCIGTKILKYVWLAGPKPDGIYKRPRAKSHPKHTTTSVERGNFSPPR